MKQPSYSFAKALQCALTIHDKEGALKSRDLKGPEWEFHESVTREFAHVIGSKPGSFYVPMQALAVKSRMSAENAPDGGFLIGQTIPGWAEALRPFSYAINSGAQMLNASPNVTFPAIQSGTTAFWLSEFEECPESNISLNSLNLRPRRCSAWLSASNQLLIQSPIAEAVLTRDLNQAIGAALDLGVFSGLGGEEPLGLLNNENVPTYTIGGATNRTKLAEMEQQLGETNARDYQATWFTTPAARKKLRTNDPGNNIAKPLWTDDDTMLGKDAFATMNVTNDRLLLGDFSDLLIVTFGLLELKDPYSEKKTDKTRFHVTVMADSGPVRAKSFIRSTDSAAQ